MGVGYHLVYLKLLELLLLGKAVAPVWKLKS